MVVVMRKMVAKALDWNVVVRGAWNLAILTPNGISRRLFDLPIGTPIEVQVSVDRPAPIRVRHDGVTVLPSETQLLVVPDTSTAAQLRAAATIAARAITSLPETPLTAAGINLRYSFDAPPDALIDDMRSAMDDRLIDAGHTISARMMRRSIPWKAGILNVEVQSLDNEGATLVLNLHRSSEIAGDLIEWLRDVDALRESAEGLLRNELRLEADSTPGAIT